MTALCIFCDTPIRVRVRVRVRVRLSASSVMILAGAF